MENLNFKTMESATPANFRRFQTPELEDYFIKKINSWKDIQINNPKTHKSFEEFVL